VQVLLVAPKEEPAPQQEEAPTPPEPEPSPLRLSTTDSMAGFNDEWVDVQKNTFTRVSP
jgi:hypothetical protein